MTILLRNCIYWQYLFYSYFRMSYVGFLRGILITLHGIFIYNKFLNWLYLRYTNIFLVCFEWLFIHHLVPMFANFLYIFFNSETTGPCWKRLGCELTSRCFLSKLFHTVFYSEITWPYWKVKVPNWHQVVSKSYMLCHLSLNMTAVIEKRNIL